MQNICINDLRSDRCQRSNLSFIAQTRPSIKLRKILGVGGQCSVLGHRQDYVDRKCRVLKRRQAVSSVLPVNRKNRIVLHITTISIYLYLLSIKFPIVWKFGLLSMPVCHTTLHTTHGETFRICMSYGFIFFSKSAISLDITTLQLDITQHHQHFIATTTNHTISI